MTPCAQIPTIDETREGDQTTVLHQEHGLHAVARSKRYGRLLRAGKGCGCAFWLQSLEKPRGRCGDSAVGEQRDTVDAVLACARDAADTEGWIDRRIG